MLNGHKNTKKQGDVGLGLAIGWFSSLGHTVCVPLTDSQDYDLIVDIDGKIHRVQVKTTTYKSEYGIFTTNLSVKGGNRTSVGKVKKFDSNKVDNVFIVTSDDEYYFIPASQIEAKHNISLGTKWIQYKVKPVPLR